MSINKETLPPYTGRDANAGPAGNTPFRTHFASLSLHMTDRIRFLQFPKDITNAVQSTVTSVWPMGLQDTRDYYGSWELKLRGNPWRASGDEATYSRRLMCKVFETLYNRGWLLSLSTDVSKKQLDKDTLIFRSQNPAPQPCQWMCISFSKNDRIRFIDAPQDVVAAMITALQPVLQSHEQFRLTGVYELKIRGYPWLATGGETMGARKILLALMEGLERHGFTVYASIDQKTGPGGDSHRSESDTWHCCRLVGWTPGQPVFHT
jgi:hypothetical protein